MKKVLLLLSLGLSFNMYAQKQNSDSLILNRIESSLVSCQANYVKYYNRVDSILDTLELYQRKIQMGVKTFPAEKKKESGSLAIFLNYNQIYIPYYKKDVDLLLYNLAWYADSAYAVRNKNLSSGYPLKQRADFCLDLIRTTYTFCRSLDKEIEDRTQKLREHTK